MKIRIILGFLILLTIFTLPSFAESIISVETDANSYKEGETIVISGKVSTIITDTPVIIQIINGDNTIVEIRQITVAEDGNYSSTVRAEGSLWSKTGDYIVRTTYGKGNIAETQFTFSPKTNTLSTTNTFEVDVGNSGTSDVQYSIEGGMVKNMLLNKNNLALIVIIESTDDGIILLDIPREMIDAKKQDNTDETFIILIDDIEVPHKEAITNSDSRIITIKFEKGDSNIEIIGTTIIPEFGVIAVMVLAIGIVVTLVVTKKNQIIYLKY